MNIENSMKYIREKLSKSKKPFLFFDSDCDGTFSYIQLKNFKKELHGISITKPLSTQLEATKLLSNENDLIIFFDTPHIEEDMIKEIKNITSAEIILVDHHHNQLDDLVKKYNFFYFNPIKLDLNDSRPSCFWAYEITKLKENLKYVSIGSVADFYLLDILNDFYDEDKTLFKTLLNIGDDKISDLLKFTKEFNFNDTQVQEDRTSFIQSLWYDSNLGKIRLFVDFFYKTKKEEIPNILKIIEKESVIDLLALIEAGQGFPFEDFALFQNKSKKLIKKVIEKNKDKEFVIFEHRGKTSYNRQLSEEVLYRLPKAKVAFLIFKKMESPYISCSFRARLPIVINDVITNSLVGLEGQGGGHPQSGGCSVKEKDFDKFKELFELEVKKRLNV